MSKLRFKNQKKYLNWIHTLGCSTQNQRCEGPIQAHHLLKPWAGPRGMGLKADDRNVIPLCMHHHSELHTVYGDEEQFFVAHGLPANYGRAMAEHLYMEGLSMGLVGR